MKELPSIRIIEIEGADIYFDVLKNIETFIKNGEDEFDDRFKEILPPNLDLYFLDSQGKLKIKPLGDEYYSYDLINLSFKYPLYIDKKGNRVFPKKSSQKSKCNKIAVSQIRKDLYLNGFILNKKEYIRYKRSSGAAKSGSCLFIKKELYNPMNKWSKTGLDENKDLCYDSLTAFEAYKTLSLSSIVDTLDLNPYNILFVKDAEVILKDQDVISVNHDQKKGLVAVEEKKDIVNNIFDGEGLLDTSVFRKSHKVNKGMMLLRSRFFKCCAFNTNLKQWFKDNNITDIKQLNGITFAKSIKDIVLVASESCLKYLKMCKGGFNEENIKRWCDEVAKDETKFGVVKYDKPTRFFDGEMVETTYQLLNSLQLKKSDINKLITPYIDYITHIRDIRRTPEFVRFFLEGEDDDKQEKEYDDETEDSNDEEIAKQILKYSSYSFKNKICLELTKIDGDIKYTNLFKKRVFASIIDSLLLKLYNGRVLVNGTYATLFGNPYEYLNYIILDKNNKPLFDKDHPTSLLNEGEISCSFFDEDEELIGSRAPHTTMGNVLYTKNKILREVDKYFNLTKQIVVVDAINNNIQQRLSGCDYDSDSLLLSNNEILVEAAKTVVKKFKVPCTGFNSTNKKMKVLSADKRINLLLNLHTIDTEISNNVVGKIVNLSQLLNSHLWNKYAKDKRYNYNNLYAQIAILAILSGTDIDSAKRSFPFSTVKEYNRIKKYARQQGFYDKKPLFFAILTRNDNHKPKISTIKQQRDKAREFKTSMDYLWEIVNDSSFLDDVRTKTIPFFDLIKHDYKTEDIQSDVYRQRDAALIKLSEIKKAVDDVDYSKDSFDLKKLNFNGVVRRAYKKLKFNINTITKVKLLLKSLEDLDDGYSKSFLLLYIISNYSKDIGYQLKDLFDKKATPLPTLRRTKEYEKPDYILFEKYEYSKKTK